MSIEILERAIERLERLKTEGTPGPWECQSKGYENAPEEHHEICAAGDGPTVVTQLGCGCCDYGLEAKPADIQMIVTLSRTVTAQIEIMRAAKRLHEYGSIGLTEFDLTVKLARAILGEDVDG